MEQYPLCWIYYLTFIFLTAFVFLKTMIGALLEVMSEEQNAKQAQQRTMGGRRLFGCSARFGRTHQKMAR